MTNLPTLFLSHGSPLQAIAHGTPASDWADLGRRLPRPHAILVASGHWETGVPMLTGNPRPQTVHDFGGFPEALYALRYPAPGAPEVAREAVALLKAAGITAGVDGCRGLDHGTWVPLLHMYPQHDVPVLQVSLQPGLGVAHHVALGRALAPLTRQGILVVGSGHATHNLRDWHAGRARGTSFPYAAAFAQWLHDRLTAGDTEALVEYRERAPEATRAHPTEEHLLPLHVAWGAAGADARVERIMSGYEGSALALDSWLLHARH